VSDIARNKGYNPFYDINDLPLSADQKEMVLEWYARKIWTLIETAEGEPDYHGKSYDPLVIEGGVAHSYVFYFSDGGRHHKFTSLLELERMLNDEILKEVRAMIERPTA
jgi:hypothetical protein